MSVPVPEALRTRVAGVPGLRKDLQDPTKEATTLAEIGRLAKSGNKIGAIKLYREQFHVELKEAKDAVELIEQGRFVQFTTSATVPTVMDIRQSSGPTHRGAFRAEMKTVVDRLHLESLGPGAMVEVRFDPERTTRVALSVLP
jgi:aspartyl/asparaginyl beta-hydroxylase (cupin superfamily)